MPSLLLGLTLLMMSGAGVWYLQRAFCKVTAFDTPGDRFLLIPTNADFQDVVDSLNSKKVLTNQESFAWLARRKGYPAHILPGRYRIKNGMKNIELVALLRSGKQEPLRLTVQNYRTIKEMAGKLSRRLEPDSVQWMVTFSDPSVTGKFGTDQANLFSIIIPDTYEFYWNLTPEEWLNKMYNESQRFWNGERKNSASRLGLTIPEVVTIASIVEKETNKDSEKDMIAGVYLNRLRIKMPLQADPTVVFAWQDFSIRRITGVHTSFESPYNTYKVTGLPPGPICLPSVASIEAVLGAKKHKYLYFCAKEDFSGLHNFAETLDQHQRNARKYQVALNRRNIH